MQSNRSKPYLNQLLIQIFNPNLSVQSIVATISIQIRTQIGNQISILYQKIVTLDQK